MDKVTHKQGTSFSKLYQVEADITDWEISSQIRRADGTLMDTLNVELGDITEELSALTTTKDNTFLWKPGTYYCDVRYSKPDGTVETTDTFQLIVEKAITQ